MTTTFRRMSPGLVVLTALGAIEGVAGAPATVDAAPSVSQFAGIYRGYVPGSTLSWLVWISPRGAVNGEGRGYYVADRGELSGSLTDGAELAIRGRETVTVGPAYSTTTVTNRFRVRASGSADAVGNIEFTSDAGETFTWSRQ